ncbi:MAG: tRNA epoxyqueuosine(34) reductase QueG [Bacteroidetes bacterium]|nr:tRNA epoxyqueuosine(34) reductase QueG [Bacteroidota bacterium]
MVVNPASSLTERIRRHALSLGFSHIGFAEAGRLHWEADRLGAWLASGFEAGMHWMARDPERRCDPRQVLEGTQSVISVAMNYFTPHEHSKDFGNARVSRYAWGDDYHDIIGERLAALEEFIVRECPEARTRRYVDTGPVMDKAWAVKAGIGWLGKHGNVITRDMGSWVFLGEILTTVALVYDTPMADFCGTCTSCLDACPTAAIVRPYIVDAARCISYLTIEHKGEHPSEAAKMNFQSWVYGCDVCQDVCPWNSFALPTEEAGFSPRPWNIAPGIGELAVLEDEEFRDRYRRSPIKRTKAAGLRRNARTLLKQRESHTDTEPGTTAHRKDYGTS